jgi:uncharacterized protein
VSSSTVVLDVDEARERTPGIPLAPVLGFVGVWMGVSWLAIGAALHPVLPGGWSAIAMLAVLSVLPLWPLSLGLSGRLYPGAALRLFVQRPFWYLFLALPLLALASTLGAVIGLPFGTSAVVARMLIAATAVLLTATALAGYLGSRRLVTRHLEVRMPRLPAAFDGLRIAQLSDLHIGPHTSHRFLAKVASAVAQASPDVIVMTGDQVDDFADDVTPFARALGDLRAPLGVYAIAGNHDVYAGWPSVARGLRAMGIHVLVNDSVALDRDGSRLWLAGTGDPAASGGRGALRHPAAPDLERTLRDVPSHEAVVVLAHNPALWPGLAQRGVDLTLSGHTHYGQLALPKRNWSLASSFLELAMGVHQRGRALLYINPGTGYWGIPFRLGTPPEVTVVTLRAVEHDVAGVVDGSLA